MWLWFWTYPFAIVTVRSGCFSKTTVQTKKMSPPRVPSFESHKTFNKAFLTVLSLHFSSDVLLSIPDGQIDEGIFSEIVKSVLVHIFHVWYAHASNILFRWKPGKTRRIPKILHILCFPVYDLAISAIDDIRLWTM